MCQLFCLFFIHFYHWELSAIWQKTIWLKRFIFQKVQASGKCLSAQNVSLLVQSEKTCYTFTVDHNVYVSYCAVFVIVHVICHMTYFMSNYTWPSFAMKNASCFHSSHLWNHLFSGTCRVQVYEEGKWNKDKSKFDYK